MKSAIHTLKAAGISLCLVASPVLLPLSMTSCERDDSVKEKVDDALDRRPAEGVKDAAEDAKDAVKDAAKETKDAVKDATN
jgi:F0F1-type ATP synthase membrane subunit b/b'